MSRLSAARRKAERIVKFKPPSFEEIKRLVARGVDAERPAGWDKLPASAQNSIIAHEVAELVDSALEFQIGILEAIDYYVAYLVARPMVCAVRRLQAKVKSDG